MLHNAWLGYTRQTVGGDAAHGKRAHDRTYVCREFDGCTNVIGISINETFIVNIVICSNRGKAFSRGCYAMYRVKPYLQFIPSICIVVFLCHNKLSHAHAATAHQRCLIAGSFKFDCAVLETTYTCR